jgi:hypothetical protein
MNSLRRTCSKQPSAFLRIFLGTRIPASILAFNKVKTTTDIHFIDVSRKCSDGKTQNRLRPEDIDHVFGTFTTFETVEKVRENEVGLNIPRYADTPKPGPEVNIPRRPTGDRGSGVPVHRDAGRDGSAPGSRGASQSLVLSPDLYLFGNLI